jgi:hypothetical protein
VAAAIVLLLVSGSLSAGAVVASDRTSAHTVVPLPSQASAGEGAGASRTARAGAPPVVETALDPTLCPAPLACDDDLAAALELESRIADHLWYGQILEIDYRSAARTLGDVASIGAWGDSGLWTGTYLAAESFRYAAARDALADAGLPDDVRASWTAQKAEAKARIDEIVAKYHLNVNIAQGWHTELAPSVDPSTSDPKVSYGGGIVQGEPGMLMRSCAPTDAPPGRQMSPNKRVFGPFPWEDGKQYYCETAPSRDTYAGTTFGLLTAFDLVGPDDPALQAMIRADVITLADFLVRHGWSYPRPHGNVNIPVGEQKIGGQKVPLTGHDFDGVVSPLFVYVPMARLNMTQAARHVAAVAGSDVEAATWEAVWHEELLTQGPLLAGSMEIDSAEPNAGYYKFNLHHLTFFTTLRLEPDPAVRLLLAHALGVMDKTTGDDINAHFEAITYALSGEAPRLQASLEHLRQWRDYRATTSSGVAVDNKARCGTAIACVPDDQWNAVIDGPAGPVDVMTRPGTSTNLRARSPLPVALRPPTDFLWQRPPTALNGIEGPTHAAPGVDYLLPYWMLRYYTEVAAPLGTPLPAWPGPSHQ